MLSVIRIGRICFACNLGWHKKNMFKLGMTVWEVGSKFLPIYNKRATIVMIWNVFYKKVDIMRFGNGENSGTSPIPKPTQLKFCPKVGKILL